VDIKGLRTLNLAGTILFGLFGIGIPLLYFFYLYVSSYSYMFFPYRRDLTFCYSILIIWLVIVIFLTIFLYRNTVKGLDRGDYNSAKRWMIIGAIAGFISTGLSAIGLITFLIFLIAFVSADEAIRSSYYPPPPRNYQYPSTPQYGPQPPPQYSTAEARWSPCPSCGKKVASSWIACPYCTEKIPKKLIRKSKK
jgi:hypothetical protein